MRTATLAAVPRGLTILVTAAAVLAPLGLILYQSFLTAPFFDARKTAGLEAYAFIFADPDFWEAFANSFLLAAMMVVIAVPLGGLLAFVMERTDLPAKRWIEPLILVPSFVSPMVLAFGYVVAAGPVGFYTVWATDFFGGAPWGIYSVFAIGVIAGLLHVPNVYVYASAALKSLGSDVEEAARVAGASPFRVAATVSLPLIMPALAVCIGARVLPGLRAVRAAAGAGRSRGPPGTVDLPLQAHEQARHAVVSPDGGGRDLHRRRDVPAGAAAALPAAERAQVRDDQGQGRTDARAAAAALEVGRGGTHRTLALRRRHRAAVRCRAPRVRIELGLRREALRGVHASSTSSRCGTSLPICARSGTRS